MIYFKLLKKSVKTKKHMFSLNRNALGKALLEVLIESLQVFLALLDRRLCRLNNRSVVVRSVKDIESK